jgi:hypothetical protein
MGQTPIWQFWTDWGVKAFGALATFLAVLVALFGSRLQHWMNPPKLTIRLANPDGWPAVLHVIDLQTNTAQRTNGFWYHVRVDNQNALEDYNRCLRVPTINGIAGCRRGVSIYLEWL